MSGTGSTNQLAAEGKVDFAKAVAGRSGTEAENLHTGTTLLTGSHIDQQELCTAAHCSQ